MADASLRIDTLVPRPFQASTRVALREGMQAGHRCQMVCSPTGSGKTILAMYLINEALKKGKSAIFVADRITLIDQTSRTAFELGLSNHGIIQGNHVMTDYSKPFQIASAQTLANRTWPDSDLIIIDEAHTQLRAWTEHIKTCRGAVVGLSATPFSVGLGLLFPHLINAVTMAELVAQGTLVPMRLYVARRADMKGAETRGGEWTDRAAAERGMQIVGDVLTAWLRHGEDRKTICFGSTIRHCEAICQQFNNAGIPAAVYTQDTTPEQRRALIEEFRKPNSLWRILISVEALAKGFDQPDVGCIIDCRPLRKSFSTWTQMIGRGARSSPATGKTDFILLDHTGNAERFATEYLHFFHHGLTSLDDGEKLDAKVRKDSDDREPVACPACGYYPFGKRCIACGFEKPVRETIEHAKGVMEAVSLGGKKLADTRRDLFNQTATYSRMKSAPEKQLWRARHLYRDLVGTFPPNDWTMENSPDVKISRETMNQIRARAIRYAKGKEKAAKEAQGVLLHEV